MTPKTLAAACLLCLPVSAASAQSIWQPKPGATFSWVLGEAGDPPLADVVDLDLFDTDAKTVASLKAKGAKLVCYINVGAWEDWREDKAAFPADVIGNDYDGWQGEKWLDIRQIGKLAPVLRARFDLCKQKGFDAIEPDNLDGFEAKTGFKITREDQLRFNVWIAREAHQRGLSIGLKNVPDMAADLISHYDWALTEDCFDQGWCAELAPFIAAGKAVFAVEYTDNKIDFEAFCKQAKALGISGLLKNRNLGRFERRCPG